MMRREPSLTLLIVCLWSQVLLLHVSEAAHDLLGGGADWGGLLDLLHRHCTAGPAVPPSRCQACREDAAPDLFSDLISAAGAGPADSFRGWLNGV